MGLLVEEGSSVAPAVAFSSSAYENSIEGFCRRINRLLFLVELFSLNVFSNHFSILLQVVHVLLIPFLNPQPTNINRNSRSIPIELHIHVDFQYQSLNDARHHVVQCFPPEIENRRENDYFFSNDSLRRRRRKISNLISYDENCRSRSQGERKQKKKERSTNVYVRVY